MVRSRTFRVALLACLVCCQRAAAETVLVQFTSPDCGPCRAMRPVLRRLAREGYLVREVDVSREPGTADRYQVTNWPTYLVFVDGQEHDRHVGASTREQLVEMMAKSTALAAARRGVGTNAASRGSISPVGLLGGAPASKSETGPMTFVAGPSPERIVEIQNPNRQQPAPAGVRAGTTPDDAGLIDATVRLSIEDPDGRSTGTGTIVDARSGEALVLTCGHLFRSSGGKGPIEISLFSAGPAGAELRTKVRGELRDFDLDRDLALVSFRTDAPVAVTPIAPEGTLLEPGSVVTNVGCDHGANPTARATRITAINRYQGHPNVEAAGAPVEGRSGGGLFDSKGRLIGVCMCADPAGDEGLYASLSSIHQKLDSLNLSMVYKAPSGLPGPTAAAWSRTQLAAASAQDSMEVRGQNPMPSIPQAFPAPWPSSVVAVNPTEPKPPASTGREASPAMSLPPHEQAALEEIQRRGAGSEIICVIRPRTPDGRSEVIKLNDVSPGFVKALTESTGVTPANPTGHVQDAQEAASPFLR